MTGKDEAVQVPTLIYSIGDAADDILKSFQLSEDDLKKYDTVKQKFDSHFVKRRNITKELDSISAYRRRESQQITL